MMLDCSRVIRPKSLEASDSFIMDRSLWSVRKERQRHAAHASRRRIHELENEVHALTQVISRSSAELRETMIKDITKKLVSGISEDVLEDLLWLFFDVSWIAAGTSNDLPTQVVERIRRIMKAESVIVNVNVGSAEGQAGSKVETNTCSSTQTDEEACRMKAEGRVLADLAAHTEDAKGTSGDCANEFSVQPFMPYPTQPPGYGDEYRAQWQTFRSNVVVWQQSLVGRRVRARHRFFVDGRMCEEKDELEVIGPGGASNVLSVKACVATRGSHRIREPPDRLYLEGLGNAWEFVDAPDMQSPCPRHSQ
eukprot:TRINITY_DN21475_c0_g1_i1.p1 TRINITY_DN21475_c0_g1~~TRINITY_DN21475_c0_g1_i1.p1  ORF type:complete len:308 (+),score=43.78 TRINITY_DN21475_c0_g1_i1:374-1297(+)